MANMATSARNAPITDEIIEVDAEMGLYKKDLVRLLNRYRKNISLPGEALRRTNVMRHVIRLSTEKPLYTPQYRVPGIHQQPFDNVIDDMLKEGVISESKSPYNSPIVVDQRRMVLFVRALISAISIGMVMMLSPIVSRYPSLERYCRVCQAMIFFQL